MLGHFSVACSPFPVLFKGKYYVLTDLSVAIQEDFSELYKPILMTDPYRCGGFPNHALIGNLKDYRTLDIDWAGVSYRLVYRVYESPAPKRVYVVSFDEHDAAYDKAKERTPRKR